jgi:hypothetical protein
MQLLSAYGGDGWQPRLKTTREELGTLWGACGLNSEWAPLRAVLLHRPGVELSASADPDAVNMLAELDIARAQQQHDALAEAYRAAGVRVAYAEPPTIPTPNQLFMADLCKRTRLPRAHIERLISAGALNRWGTAHRQLQRDRLAGPSGARRQAPARRARAPGRRCGAARGRSHQHHRAARRAAWGGVGGRSEERGGLCVELNLRVFRRFQASLLVRSNLRVFRRFRARPSTLRPQPYGWPS